MARIIRKCGPRMATSRSARPISCASMSLTSTTSTTTDDDSFEFIARIGRDALSLITSFLSSDELIPVSQVNRIFYDNLQRCQSYYHRPFPSFTRTDFNLYHYRKWRETRQSLIMTPEQLIRYSHSRVMTHQSDIELHIGQCFIGPSSPTYSINPTLNEKLSEARASVALFHDVRALRLVFSPASSDIQSPCSCPDSWTAAENWMGKLGEICLTTWAAHLISFELEIHPDYQCGRALRFLLSHAYQCLTSIQHLGLYVPSHAYLLDGLSTSFRFPSDDVGLIVFHSQTPSHFVMEHRSPAQLPTGMPVNAAHCIWLPWSVCGDRERREDALKFFDETQQLITNQASGAFQSRTPPLSSLPLISVRRQQLRTLRISEVNDGTNLPIQIQSMKQQLELLVANFTSSHPPPPTASESHLEWLTICDEFSEFHWSLSDDQESTTHFVNYRPYLHHLRSTLRMLNFYSTVNIGAPQGPLPQPPLPIYLAHHEHQIETYVWPALESMDLRFRLYETVGENELEALAPTTWKALAQTLPQLESLGLSICLLPSPATCPPHLTGLLTQIKQLHLYSYPQRFQTWPFYTNHLAKRLTVICMQLRQLESLHLNHLDPTKQMTDFSTPQQQFEFYETLLIPLLTSSYNLRHIHLEYSPINEPNLQLFERIHRNTLFLFYAVWKLLQPSFDPPLEYTNVPAFVRPFLSPPTRASYHLMIARLQQSRETASAHSYDSTSWHARLLKGINSWQNGLREWISGVTSEEEQRTRHQEVVDERRTQFEQICTQLQHKLNTFLDQHTPPTSTSPVVRTLTISLETRSSRREPHEFDTRL